jgi:hypothetical protein
MRIMYNSTGLDISFSRAGSSFQRQDRVSAIKIDQFFPEMLLTRAQVGREVIQDFCPLAESLEWQVG